MEVVDSCPAPTSAPAPAPAPTGGDWRSQLHGTAREVMVKRIMQALTKHLPIRDSEWLTRFRNIAKGFEDKFYTTAASQSSYSRKIAMLLLYVETPNHNPKYRGAYGTSSETAPGIPPPGNNPTQMSAAPLMSQQKTRQGNTSAFVQASSLPNPDEKGKAPMPDSPGEESNLSPLGSDDEPQHPEADTTDKFELAEPSENTNLMEGKSTADDHVFSELKKLELRRNNHQGIFFDEIRNLWDMDMLEEDLNYESMSDRTTNLKKRRFDGASSSSPPVFGEATSGAMYDQ